MQRYLCVPGDVEQGCATPLVICVCMWAGSAMPPGAGCGPATHTRKSPPDWANNVRMRGCVCHGMLLEPSHPHPLHAVAATISPSAGGSQRQVLSDRSKAL